MPLAMLVLWWSQTELHAQNPAAPASPKAPASPLTRIQQVLDLRAEDFTAGDIPVHFRGVVTYPNSRRVHFFVHDQEAGVVVNLGDTNLCPQFGQQVEVEGVAVRIGAQNGVNATAVRVVGTAAMPAPRRATLREVTEVRQFARWVEVEGVVLQVRTSAVGAVSLHLAGDDYWAVVNLSEPIPDAAFKALLGARVRIQGVNTGPSTSAVLCRKSDYFTVVTPGRADPFTAPATNAAALLRMGKGFPERVKLQAVVVHVARDGWVFLRDGTTPFQADYLYPFDPGDRSWRPQFTVPIPQMRPGDVIELVGSPMTAGPYLSLRYSQMRVLQAGEEPRPVQSTVADIVSGKVANDLVTLRGRHLKHMRSLVAGKQNELLQLKSGQDTLEVVLESSGSNQLASLQSGDLMEATGIVRPHDGNPPYRLHLRSASDVHSLGPDPELLRIRRMRWAGVIAAIVLSGLGWIVFLRHKLARQRELAAAHARTEATVRELNSRLEQRVAERTAELEKAKEDLRVALEAERELNELKSRFVSLVSHEFRTPLGITMSAVELLRNYMDRLPKEKHKVLLDDIYSSTLRMASLMEQVLLLGRVEAGKMGFNPRPLDIEMLGGKLVDEMLSATNRKCPVQFTAQGDLLEATGDEGLLRHVFSNLLSNAVKYSPAEATVDFEVKREGEAAVFTVRDQGIGIPVADQARLFEAFHRASNVGETPGTGLGLLIVKRCVEMHQGTIAIDSAPGKGTTFTVRLPLFRGAGVESGRS